MKERNFESLRGTVEAEIWKLRSCEIYLNKAGQNRLRALQKISGLCGCARDSRELLRLLVKIPLRRRETAQVKDILWQLDRCVEAEKTVPVDWMKFLCEELCPDLEAGEKERLCVNCPFAGEGAEAPTSVTPDGVLPSPRGEGFGTDDAAGVSDGEG